MLRYAPYLILTTVFEVSADYPHFAEEEIGSEVTWLV